MECMRLHEVVRLSSTNKSHEAKLAAEEFENNFQRTLQNVIQGFQYIGSGKFSSETNDIISVGIDQLRKLLPYQIYWLKPEDLEIIENYERSLDGREWSGPEPEPHKEQLLKLQTQFTGFSRIGISATGTVAYMIDNGKICTDEITHRINYQLPPDDLTKLLAQPTENGVIVSNDENTKLLQKIKNKIFEQREGATDKLKTLITLLSGTLLFAMMNEDDHCRDRPDYQSSISTTNITPILSTTAKALR